VGLLILLGLGTWQVERKAWKEALIETLTKRLNADPVVLPPPGNWAQMTPENWELRRVRLSAEFGGGDDVLVYTGGSALRDDVKSPGYFVFAPARLPDGSKVVVNRGYVPGRSYPRRPGAQEIVGVLRWPEAPSWFISVHDATGGVWTMRDQRAMAEFKGWGTVAPFYLEQEAPVPAGGLPHPAPLKVRLRNDHLQYAITWYGLAAVLVVMFAIWTVHSRREQQD
jgi:cytochrome oxidase assembly protein ShyY1